MKKLVVIAASMFVAIVAMGAPNASADEDLKPGGKGTCTAMHLDGSVIAVQAAPPKGDSHDYVACGNALRERIKPLVCQKAKESQPFLYKISDNKPYRSSVRCP